MIIKYNKIKQKETNWTRTKQNKQRNMKYKTKQEEKHECHKKWI